MEISDISFHYIDDVIRNHDGVRFDARFLNIVEEIGCNVFLGYIEEEQDPSGCPKATT